MHRSASWSRYSEDYFKQFTAYQSPGGLKFSSSTTDDTNLPIYDPVVELTKKEKARIRFAENAVHIIPFVLFACAIVLWIFSNPSDVASKGDSLGPEIEKLNIDGEIEHHSNVLKWG
ncbi:uncharacterized protein LOC129322908 isoform X3 [Prosopis cineraria]|uniref:uncharacterized protein LOC129322908 isoform X3 n=1 Tax=Prosopis cineraria TaxID=364024 RepID=UPI00240EA0EB|nr:uncharacterized protein LOC129322908 isoform X3 [Prosopis cineraria]